MIDYETFLLRLNENLNILREREAKYAGNAPVELLNQINDHAQAIALTQQVIDGELAEAKWREALQPLLVSLPEETRRIVTQHIEAENIGVVGDFAHVEGGIHFHTHTTPAGRPLQRPPRAKHFTDRKDELKQLLADLQPGKVVTLCGPGGIGKTALAAEAVWALAPEKKPPDLFPDGIIFHSFYDQPEATRALEAIALAFGEEPKPTPRIAAMRALAGKQVLLLLDGTEAADDLGTVLDVRGGCGAIVTSRVRKDAVAERQDMKPLVIDEAVELLRKWGGVQVGGDDTAQRICQQVGGLPLAVRLVGRYLSETDETATEYLKWLEKTPIAALSHGEHREESVDILLQCSLSQVSEDARAGLAIVGLLALSPFENTVIAVGLETSSIQANLILGELVNFGLLHRVGLYYEVIHALIHTYARLQLTAPPEKVKNLGSYFQSFIQAHRSSYEKLDVARPHIMAILTQLMAQEIWEPVIDIAHLLTRSKDEKYLQMRGYWNDEEDCLRKAISASEHLQEETDKRAHWSRQTADLKFGLGGLLFTRDQYDQAIDLYLESLDLYETLENCQHETIHANLCLGETHFNRGEFNQAFERFEKSLQICDQINETGKLLALAHWWLGRTYRRIGIQQQESGNDQQTKISYQQAKTHYWQSLAIYQDKKDDAQSASVLIRLGNLEFDQANNEAAWNYFIQCETVLDQATGNQRAVAEIRRELANNYLWKNKFDKAEQLHKDSLKVFEDLTDKPNIAWTIHSLGDTYFEKARNEGTTKENHKKYFDQAEEKYLAALKYFDELGISHGKAYAFDHLGMIKLKQNLPTEASQYFEQGLEIFRASGLKDGIGFLLLNLGDAKRDEGKLKEASNCYTESLQIWKDFGRADWIERTEIRLQEVSKNTNGFDYLESSN